MDAGRGGDDDDHHARGERVLDQADQVLATGEVCLVPVECREGNHELGNCTREEEEGDRRADRQIPDRALGGDQVAGRLVEAQVPADHWRSHHWVLRERKGQDCHELDEVEGHGVPVKEAGGSVDRDGGLSAFEHGLSDGFGQTRGLLMDTRRRR